VRSLRDRDPGASRPGISRHLRVLRECGVVVSLPDGKTRTYALKAQPLANLRNGWLARFADMHGDSLKALRRRVESKR